MHDLIDDQPVHVPEIPAKVVDTPVTDKMSQA